MSTPAASFRATVTGREQLSDHFVRLTLAAPGFASTGIPDEWVALTVPGQFQTRYYTVRTWRDPELVLDVVVHEHGLVTEWAAQGPVIIGDQVTISAAKGSFAMPETANWLYLVGDLTALPAIARIIEEYAGSLPIRAWIETPDAPLVEYLSAGADTVTWTRPPAGTETGTAALVEAIDWPAPEGYFWMAGESAQMRAIRKHLMREVQLPSRNFDVMGYWRGGGQKRQPRAVDPTPGATDRPTDRALG